MIILVLRWITDDGTFREEAYGPWRPADDLDHLAEVEAFARRWRERHPHAQLLPMTLYAVQPPEMP